MTAPRTLYDKLWDDHVLWRQPDGRRIGFRVDPYLRDCLLNGLDEIAATMIHEAAISAYEIKYRPDTTLAQTSEKKLKPAIRAR